MTIKAIQKQLDKDRKRKGSDVKVKIHQQDPYTVAFATVKIHLVDGVTGETKKKKLHTIGFSKRNPIDERDDKLGRKIARGRALKNMAYLMVVELYSWQQDMYIKHGAPGGAFISSDRGACDILHGIPELPVFAISDLVR